VNPPPGEPANLADAFAGERIPLVQELVQKNEGQVPTTRSVKAVPAADGARTGSQRWGILEASQRISAMRWASQARTRGTREMPVPERDLEIKRVAPESKTLDDLLREELQ
jgi:hypothetical protein